MIYFQSVITLVDDFTSQLTAFISSLFTALTTPIADLTSKWADLPGLGTIQIIGDVFDYLIEKFDLGDTTLFGFIIGNTIILLVIFTIVKWVIDILP